MNNYKGIIQTINTISEELMGTANYATSVQRSKTANLMTSKQIQSHTGGGTYQNVYGERLSDVEISLSYADVYKLHAVYESTSNATDAVSPTLTLSNSTGTFTVGEIITGSASRRRNAPAQSQELEIREGFL